MNAEHQSVLSPTWQRIILGLLVAALLPAIWELVATHFRVERNTEEIHGVKAVTDDVENRGEAITRDVMVIKNEIGHIKDEQSEQKILLRRIDQKLDER